MNTFWALKLTIIEVIVTGRFIYEHNQTCTIHFGGLGERELHSATVGVIPLTHSTFVLLLIRAHLLVTAYVLQERAKVVSHSEQTWLLHGPSLQAEQMMSCVTQIWFGLFQTMHLRGNMQTKQRCSQNMEPRPAKIKVSTECPRWNTR